MSRIFTFELDRSVLEFRGADVVRFLNGQLSNDVSKLRPNETQHACVMTAKGRMNAEVWLTRLKDGIRLDGPPGMSDELLTRFERYIISDDVEVTTPSDWKLVHRAGDVSGIVSPRFGIAGSDFWLKNGEDHFPEKMSALELESFRISHGIPAWGPELDENTIPMEAGLDRDAIDFHKGCYVGQEVISRLKSIGHVNRLLVRFITDNASNMAVGTSLMADDKPIGSVTSVAPSLDLDKRVALAYVKRAFSKPETVLQTSDGVELKVLSLQP